VELETGIHCIRNNNTNLLFSYIYFNTLLALRHVYYKHSGIAQPHNVFSIYFIQSTAVKNIISLIFTNAADHRSVTLCTTVDWWRDSLMTFNKQEKKNIRKPYEKIAVKLCDVLNRKKICIQTKWRINDRQTLSSRSRCV